MAKGRSELLDIAYPAVHTGDDRSISMPRESATRACVIVAVCNGRPKPQAQPAIRSAEPPQKGCMTRFQRLMGLELVRSVADTLFYWLMHRQCAFPIDDSKVIKAP